MPPTPRTKPHLTAALAKNAARAAAEKHAEVLAAGREDLALIREKMQLVTDAFYDIGLALQRLAAPGVAQVLGFKGFGELVTKGLGMGLRAAGELMEIVTWVKRADALAWKREKSAALVELAKATPAKDTPASLMKKPLRLASGRTFDPRKADAEAVRAAAKEERRARAERTTDKPRRGVTSTKEERDLGARLEAALHATGLREARVTVLARPGAGADLRIERVPVARLDALAKAARAVHPGGMKRISPPGKRRDA